MPLVDTVNIRLSEVTTVFVNKLREPTKHYNNMYTYHPHSQMNFSLLLEWLPLIK